MEEDLLLPDRIAEWKMEPELACPIPRRVVLNEGFSWYPFSWLLIGLGAGFGMWLSDERTFWLMPLLFGGIAVAILFHIKHRRQSSKLLVEGGMAARGVVVKDLAIGVSEPVCLWRVIYETADGSRLNLELSDDLPPKLAIGHTLTILYLPEAPERAMPYKDCAYRAVGQHG